MRGADGARDGLFVEGPVSFAQAQVICQRAEQMLTSTCTHELICHVGGRADLSVVDVLARLALLTQRVHARLQIRALGDAGELAQLVAFTGLELLKQPLEAGRQAETRE